MSSESEKTMSEHKTLIEMIEQSGMAPKLPQRLEPAVKFVNPDFTTHGGFSWWGHGKWVKSPDVKFNPTTCESGGLHVANTVAAAQSGGARLTHCLWVGVDPAEAGPWEDGKRKAPRVYVAGPIDLVGIIRSHGKEAYLSGAYLSGANLAGANLTGAYLSGAYLAGAYLSGAYLSGADLAGAYLSGAYLSGANLAGADLAGAYLSGAYLTGTNLDGAYLAGTNLAGADLSGAYLAGAYLSGAYLSGAYLSGADLAGADLSGAYLTGAYGRGDWDELVKRGAIR